MSGSLSPQVAAVPSTTATATNLLSLMAALNGTPTDYNVGSQIRTFSEATGLVVEQQGIGNTALAFEALAYGAMSLFGITQVPANAATGLVTFATSLPVSAAPVSPVAVAIPAGTLVQTAGGTQFATLLTSVLASGTTNVVIGSQATTAGAVGNISSGSITGAPLTPLGYPLVVTNSAPFGGGVDAGNLSQAVAAFTAKAMSLGLASPVAVANAPIGVTASGTGEMVVKAGCYEPWLAAGSGAGSGQASFTVYIDNGTGGASASLIAAVQAQLNGSTAQNQSGYRPIGVPYAVSGVTPVFANVGVTGILLPGLLATGSVTQTIGSGITSYFNNLGVSTGSGVTATGPSAAYQSQIAGVVADAGLGGFSSLTVNLLYASATNTPVTIVSGAVGTRVILSALSVNLSVGS
jgi:hypothetical protein